MQISTQDLGTLGTFYGGVLHSLSPVWAWTSSFLVLLILILILILFARYIGRGPFVSVVAALYIAYAFYMAFPYAAYLPTAPALTALGARLALYAGFFIVSYLVLRRIAASDFISIGTLGLVVVSFFTAGFLLVLAYQSFPVREVYHFSPSLDKLFEAKEWFFAWFSAPLVSLFIFAK